MVRRTYGTTTRRNGGLLHRFRGRREYPATTTYRSGGLLSRLRGRREYTTTTTTTTTKTTRTRSPRDPLHHHHRRPSIGDKISGAVMKFKGTLTRRPGLKAAGTRRMHGTDGRYSRRTY